ncbi:Hypothetical protein R9X50_00576700 [Acrodontium crateriforme]|uniref:AAA+ ATPase domain-containing protein n=1 Tax=Acrodontium crateriforme TaxID=150365 RepID=A0AAQ3M761_9PEZI|nr:Hypothetical protein R9X50_00576700 [Acrodontium crateriforme]
MAPPYHPLRLHPPDSQYSLISLKIGMPDLPSFVVRLLPVSGSQPPDLDGAFRVHFLPDALIHLGLSVGDLCQITGENGVVGVGVAWRGTDRMGNSPKLRPVKMTERFCSAFGFKEGEHVTVTKTKSKFIVADSITLSDVTPSDFGNPANADDGRWLTRCAYLLSGCEALANGVTFDVPVKKMLKKRFCIDQIVSSAAPSGTPALFTCTDKTKVVFTQEPETAVEKPVKNGHVLRSLDASRIGGLIEQVRLLNRRLDNLLRKSSKSTRGNENLPWSSHILLHGYEGTGKTLLLKQLEQTNACRMFKLDKNTLASVPASKSVATIQSIFNDALLNQPSIVIMDRVEKLAPVDTDLHADVLEAEFDKIKGSSVLVVGATRSVSSLDNALIGPGRFAELVELPIPDIASRRRILNVLLDLPAESDSALVSTISLKTHAFTGSDLAFLVDRAQANAIERYYDESEDYINIHARASLLDTLNPTTLPNGSVHSQDTTEVELSSPEPQLLSATVDDFEVALTKVRPTALREVILEKPTVHWTDIGGSALIKQRFDETLGWPLHFPHILAKHRAKPQRGVLLYGPPGCSKTLTAQAVATNYDLNFLAVKGAELISMYVGESERAVREVFRKARQAAPCVIFFDEIDSIGSERDNTGTKGLNVLTTLLNEMDGFEASNGVLVLAATNKPEVLDSALMRPGRFDSHVYLGPPNALARQGIFEIALRGLPVGQDVNMDELVEKTEGYSGAEIVRICETAKLGAMRREIAAEIVSKTGGSDDTAHDPVSPGEAKWTAELQGKYCRADFDEAIKGVKRGITKEMIMAYEDFARRDE